MNSVLQVKNQDFLLITGLEVQIANSLLALNNVLPEAAEIPTKGKNA